MNALWFSQGKLALRNVFKIYRPWFGRRDYRSSKKMTASRLRFAPSTQARFLITSKHTRAQSRTVVSRGGATITLIL